MKNTIENKQKYFIYARKSSEPDDRQVLSIESQIDELKSIAKKENLKILNIFTESKSAKEPGRPVFNELINRIYNGEAKGILCWKLDRLARNPVDGGQISWLLQQGVIESIKTFGREYKPSDNVLIMSVELGMANQFIRDLRDNTKRGLKTKVDKGWMPQLAPIGYINNVIDKTIEKDPERFEIVKRMWKLMLTGTYSAVKVLKIATDEWKLKTKQRKRIGGTPLSRSAIYTVFTNPFYYGYFRRQGELCKGLHPAMITEEEFWEVQKILGKKGVKRPKSHDFTFTGMIRCGECGAMITAEHKHKVQKNGTKHEYIYYHCTKRKKDTNCTQPSIRDTDMEGLIADDLLRLKISEKMLRLALEYIREENKEEIQQREAIYKNLESSYRASQKHIDNLIDMRVRELIGDDEYIDRKNKLLVEKKQIKAKLDLLENRSNEWLELTEKSFIFAHEAYELFINGTKEDKKIILQIFGSNLVLKNKKLYIEPVKPFACITNHDKNSCWLRSSDSNREPSR